MSGAVAGWESPSAAPPPDVANLIFGGFAGTAVLTGLLYVVAPMMGVRMDIAAMLGDMIGVGWAAGMVGHLVMGIVMFPLAFGYGIRILAVAKPVVAGTVAGLALWLASQALIMPLAGLGMFASGTGDLRVSAASLLGHLIYGIVLGSSVEGRSPKTSRDIDVETCDPGAGACC